MERQGYVNSALTAGKTHCHSVHSSNMFRKHMKPFERFIDPLQMFPGALHIVIVLLIFRFTDIEDFDSIVSVSERLNELATHVADERLQAQLLSLESIILWWSSTCVHVVDILTLLYT